ncbi:sugar ABC transporter permease [Streptomyces sp. A7024]|uniref:Sugar ABC transporter permease n=1 Tax=Streptomyces coryli TaxID=1128680 RepID=A0A6G4U3U2_9ACTN|nr:sugar ABC transporter permease [Streptomyces coryli]NGN66038.1 sugar ABC transporter permease [Streptomyces coryli]
MAAPATTLPAKAKAQAKGKAAEARDRRGAARRPESSPLERNQRRTFWPFLTPALVMFVLFFVAPIVFSGWLSLNRWDGLGEMTSRGFANYPALFRDPVFTGALKNTGLLLFVGGGCVFVLSFAITVVLRDMRDRNVVRYVLFFPVLVNPLVFGVMVGLLFRPSGIVNFVMEHIGISDPPKWLGEQNLMTMIVAVTVWSATGFYTTILMSGVEQIPRSYYEAAELDGAGAWQRFRHVTLPLSWDVVTVCAIFWTISTVKVFELILVFGGSVGGAPPKDTWTSAMYVYQRAFNTTSTRDFGISSAAALVSLVLITIAAVLLRRMMRRDAIQFS